MVGEPRDVSPRSKEVCWTPASETTFSRSSTWNDNAENLMRAYAKQKMFLTNFPGLKTQIYSILKLKFILTQI